MHPKAADCGWPGAELSLFRILHVSIEVRADDAPGHVFGDLDGVASDTDEGPGVKWDGLALPHRADHRRAFREHGRKDVRLQFLGVVVI